MNIRIVTDSTSDLPTGYIERHQITVLPAYINVGEKSYQDGIDLSRRDFYEQLPHFPVQPTTAAPATGVFTEVYERLAAEGATEILSIHVSSTLSGFLNAARVGAEAAEGVEVTLFDSRQLTMGLGLLVQVAVEAAAEGCSMAQITARLQERLQRTHVFAALDTLEFLRRSGRVSWTEFGLGTLLKIKPLIHVYDGEARSAAKVRTRAKALTQLIDLVESLGRPEQLALLHTNAPEEAQAFKQRIAHLIPAGQEPIIVEVTPAIGSHIGPGAVGVACIMSAGQGGGGFG